MRYAIGDVIETTGWSSKWDGFYVIISVGLRDGDYTVKQLFCPQPMPGNKRSFTSGHNVKIGHIDDISSFVAP